MTTETILQGESKDFDAAFAELQAPAVAPAAATPAADVIDVTAKEILAVAAETAPAAAETPAIIPEIPAGTVGESVPVVPAPVVAPVADASATRIAELEAQLAARPAIPAVAPVATGPVAPAAAAPIYTADEAATIEKYQKDWPDIHAGEALVRRAEYRDLVGYIFEQVRSQLDPLVALSQTQQGRTQYTDLVQLVPDYDDVRDKTLAWVDTQPAYLKKAYQEVANGGSPSDVADLINRFKKETGYAAPATVAAPVAAAPAAPAGLPAAAKAAVATLRVVQSARSAPSAGADPDDFAGAFKEFSASK